MRKFYVLWLLGAAAVMGASSPASTNATVYTTSSSAQAKLAELRAILDAEDDDDLDDDLVDPDGDDSRDEDDSGDGTPTPT